MYGVIHFGIDEFLRKADGMFAFAIYNKSRREVFLARDRVGEKPLYFFKSKEGLSFASELKVLGEIYDENLSIDITGLQLYLILRYITSPYTILSGISKLAPGHYIRFSEVNPEVEQIPYFSWDPHASEIPATKENYQTVVKATLNMLVKSLESRLMSDVPLGFFLSGGVDSTLCAALIRKFMGREVNTYTIGFKGDSNSEHLVSEQTAKLLVQGTQLRSLIPLNCLMSLQVFMKNLMNQMEISCIPTFLLCSHARKVKLL